VPTSSQNTTPSYVLALTTHHDTCRSFNAPFNPNSRNIFTLSDVELNLRGSRDNYQTNPILIIFIT
jgi:hypothetical protein